MGGNSVHDWKATMMALVLMASALAIAGPLSQTASAAAGTATVAAAVSPPTVTAIGTSDYATSIMSRPASFSWTHTPTQTQPTLVTLVCAVYSSDAYFFATYGGATMNWAISNQQSTLYVGMLYLINPPPGAQLITVTLAQVDVNVYTNAIECSATTWAGTSGIDMSIASTSYEFGSTQMYVSIAPKTTVPSNEVFFSAVDRFEWGAGTAWSVSGAPTGVAATMVEQNTAAGTGAGKACQAIQGTQDVGCIASALLLSGGTAMTYSWYTGYGAYAVVAGIGIKSAATIWAPGYMGNELYMTAGVDSGNPLMIYPQGSVWAGQAIPAGTLDVLNNAVNLSVGKSWRTSQGTTLFQEYYSGGGYMVIDIPVAAAAGWHYPTNSLQVSCIGIYVDVNNAPTANVGMLAQTNINSGINTTGDTWGNPAPTQNYGVWDLALDGLSYVGASFIPGAGEVVGAYQVMKALESVVP